MIIEEITKTTKINEEKIDQLKRTMNKQITTMNQLNKRIQQIEKYLKEHENKWKIIKNVKEIKKNINETKRISQNNIEMIDLNNMTQKNQKQELDKMNEQIKLL